MREVKEGRDISKKKKGWEKKERMSEGRNRGKYLKKRGEGK